MDYWDETLWENTLWDYSIALAGACMVTIAVLAVVRLYRWRMERIATSKTGPMVFFLVWHALGSTKTWVVFTLAVILATVGLEVSEGWAVWLRTAFVTLLIFQILLWGNRALLSWGERYDQEQIHAMGARFTTLKMFLFFGRLFLFGLGFLIIVDSIPGVQITALVASLGIGGIAVALALQNILSDIFASLTITLDQPFVIGDFIIVGELLGAVEHIGLKTTRIRSLSGEQLIFSNNDLLNSRIRNFKRMHERRVAFAISITYDTPTEKIRKIPGKIQEFIEALPDTRFDRAHFKAHAAYSLDFEIVYYVDGPDFNRFMDRQQAVNLAIHEYFEAEEIEFAFPTQTLYHRRDAKAPMPAFAVETVPAQSAEAAPASPGEVAPPKEKSSSKNS